MPSVSLVIIGRNEGERLRLCLQSALLVSDRIVYADSGSTDGSLSLARDFGIAVVALDTALPYTAARGRNAGLARALALWPDTRFVQFIDGDCELDPHWIAAGLEILSLKSTVAIVCGRRRERFPEQTLFNRVCDIEWDGPSGSVERCGGDALVRVEPLLAISGYDDSLIAGEDDDMCYRLRCTGWEIFRLPNDMTRHDVAMTTWSQWWHRNRRSGHAGAEAWQRRGAEDPRLFKYVISNLLWGLPLFWPAWPILWWRVYRASDAVYATHIVLGKVPHCVGQLGFWWSRIRAKRMRLIEYKPRPKRDFLDEGGI